MRASANRVSTLEHGDDSEHSANDISNLTRSENISRNLNFLAGLGFHGNEPGLVTTRNTNFSNSSRKRSKDDTLEFTSRKSRRLENMNEGHGEKDAIYRCDQCFQSKTYESKRALNLHRTKYCPKRQGYIPPQFRCNTFQNFFISNLNDHDGEISTNAQSPVHVPVFELTDEDLGSNTDEESIVREIQNNGEMLANECAEIQPLNQYKLHQEQLCDNLFGKEYLKCNNFCSIKQELQKYGRLSSDEDKRNLAIYRYVSDKGLSRQDGDELLKLLKTFEPKYQVPKSFKSIEVSARKEASALQDYHEIIIPWIQSWKMDKLPGYPPVKVYVRSLFHVISEMLVDPEIMYIWRAHIHMSYHRAVDKDGRQVYSDVMSSPWAEESVRMVHEKDSAGHLLPVILYTDGVQVSPHSRNKVTPVIVTLGIFSDDLLQKDISKRVITYMPNFKDKSKDCIAQHLVKTLNISKTKVNLYKFI